MFRLADSGGGGQLKITALAVDPRDENHVYTLYSVYHGGFTVETTNGGGSWTTLSGPDAGTATPTLLAVSAGAAPGAPAEVWDVLGGPSGSSLYHSVDGGGAWGERTAGLPIANGIYINALLFDAHSVSIGRVYALASAAHNTLYATRAGEPWVPFRPALADKAIITADGHVLTGDPQTPLHIVPLVQSGAWPVGAAFPTTDGAYRLTRLWGQPLAPQTGCAPARPSSGFPGCQAFDKGVLQIDAGRRLTLRPIVRDLLGGPAPVGGANSSVTYRTLAVVSGQRVPPPAGFQGGVAAVPDGVFIPASAHLTPAPGYIVPAYFWRYMTNTALNPEGWRTDIGLPLTKALTAVVDKGPAGRRRIVVQAFQQGILTDDATNPPAFQIERANVGSDYATRFPCNVR